MTINNQKKKPWIFLLFSTVLFLLPSASIAFPIYAQQAYENPREANGRIVCANCHLAQKPTLLESPQAVLPDTIFETEIDIPYDTSKNQILGDGQKGKLNVGAVMILPENFKLAPKAKMSPELKAKMKGLYITPYSADKENILVVGPIAGDQHQRITFPILSPNPETNKNSFFVKYPIYVGANRGRGQVYPSGAKTNNNVITASTTGKVKSIKLIDNKEFEIDITSKTGETVIQRIPKGLSLIVKENEIISQDQAITENPNVGGFGQTETEIVLQDPSRIYAYFIFVMSIIVTQSIFVFKKKQFEKVQIAEADF